MQKSWVFIFVLILTNLINFISAAYWDYGGYTNYGCGGNIGCWFDTIPESTIILLIFWTLFFLVISFSLKNVFGVKEKGTAIIAAAAISLLIVYGLYKNNIGYDSYFYNFVPIGVLSQLFPIIFLVALGLSFWKFGFEGTLYITGTLFVLLSFIVYEKSVLLTLGIIFIVVGLLWRLFSSKPKLFNRKTHDAWG